MSADLDGFGPLAHLTDLLDYESEVLSQFMNLDLSFYFSAILPIQSHKTKLEALRQLILKFVYEKMADLVRMHNLLIF
jgi:hypothetical protein